jgi:probable HAF family extracellular repeat protein
LRFLAAPTVTLLLATASAGFGEPRFQGLGVDPAAGLRASTPYGVSADGSVVVGTAHDTVRSEAFRWTRETGVVVLGDLPGGGGFSSARAVSADGTVVVGHGSSPEGVEAFRWTAADGMRGLGDLPGGDFESRALAISADGSVVVGQGRSGTGASGAEAFLWTAAAGMRGLGRFGRARTSSANGVSADGTLIVGLGSLNSIIEAWRWTEASGFDGLGTLPGAPRNFTQAFGVSPDGRVIVGNGSSPNGTEAFRWTEAGGFEGLGDFPGGTYSSSARSASEDGQRVVGSGRGEGDNIAFLWTPEQGQRRIDDVLRDLGVSTGGWTLRLGMAISSDGTTIAGVGRNPEGVTEAWIAVLPRPCPAAPDPACAEHPGRIVVRNGPRRSSLRWRILDTRAAPGAADALICLYADGVPAGGSGVPRLRARPNPWLDLIARGRDVTAPALPLEPGTELRAELHGPRDSCVGSSFSNPDVNRRGRYRAATF